MPCNGSVFACVQYETCCVTQKKQGIPGGQQVRGRTCPLLLERRTWQAGLQNLPCGMDTLPLPFLYAAAAFQDSSVTGSGASSTVSLGCKEDVKDAPTPSHDFGYRFLQSVVMFVPSFDLSQL